MTDESTAAKPPIERRVRVWDVPVRVFHWTIVALLLVSFVTAKIGGNALEIHELSGFTILTLVLFRLLWGVFGSTHARFSDFVRGIAAAKRYAAVLRSGRSIFYAGHNPLGGWMIVALLLDLLVQAGTGLFANDDIMIEGPLAKHVSKATSDLLSRIHQVNFYVLLTLVILHIAAALYYLWIKRDNLIVAMVTGRKRLPQGESTEDFRGGPLWLAMVLLAACALLVWLVVR